MSVKTEIESAEKFGEQIEDVVIKRGQYPTGDREIHLVHRVHFIH